MQAHRHGMGHRWRRFARQNRATLFVFFFLAIILGVVALLFWVMTSIRFVNQG